MPKLSPAAAEVEARLLQAMRDKAWPEVARLSIELDALTQAPAMPPLVASALWYAEQGLHVFPLQPRSKIPYPRSRGCKDASSDPEKVRAWWTARPDSNIGLATGHGVDVIDVDGAEGVISWARTDDLPPILGVVSTVRAEGGGTHLYVAASGQGNRARMGPGLDYRGLGGYVVAPPSVGPTGRTYRWRRPLDLARKTCAACGQPMTAVEPGQASHPCCDPVEAAA